MGTSKFPSNRMLLLRMFNSTEVSFIIPVLIMPLSLQITVKNRSTILTAPPRFASGLHCPITLLDIIEDVYERQKRNASYDVGEVNFYRDIDPIFRRMYMISWTNFRANEGHGEYFSIGNIDSSESFH